MRKRSLAEKPPNQERLEPAVFDQVVAPKEWIQEEEKLLNERKRWVAERSKQRAMDMFPGLDLKRTILWR